MRHFHGRIHLFTPVLVKDHACQKYDDHHRDDPCAIGASTGPGPLQFLRSSDGARYGEPFGGFGQQGVLREMQFHRMLLFIRQIALHIAKQCFAVQRSLGQERMFVMWGSLHCACRMIRRFLRPFCIWLRT